MILDWKGRAAAIKGELQKLPLKPNVEETLDLAAGNIAYCFDEDAKAGKGSPNFRASSTLNAFRDLDRFRSQADRLQRQLKSNRIGAAPYARQLKQTIAALHKTAILALANSSFCQMWMLASFCDCVASNLEYAPTATDIGTLRRAVAAAELAKSSLKARQGGPKREGALTNRRADAATSLLFSYFWELTGKRPSITIAPSKERNPATGHFVNTLRAVFKIINIKGSTEAYARKAINRVKEADKAKFRT